jgi:hypothetical protein
MSMPGVSTMPDDRIDVSMSTFVRRFVTEARDVIKET